MATKVKYRRGYVMARRWKRKPKEVPEVDTILLRLSHRRGDRHDLYLRPDEAVAIITVLASEVWNEIIEKDLGGKCE